MRRSVSRSSCNGRLDAATETSMSPEADLQAAHAERAVEVADRLGAGEKIDPAEVGGLR